MESLATTEISRRNLLRGAAAVLVLSRVGGLGGTRSAAAATSGAQSLDDATTMTMEAWADTIVPGEKRWPGDVAVAGAAPGPSAAAAGALDMLQMPEVGLAPVLPGMAQLLNGHAQQYAGQHGIELDPDLPPFVSLNYDQRSALVLELTTPSDAQDHPYWVLLSSASAWSFDTAASMHTVDAIAEAHPGLTWNGFPPPDADGIWRHPQFSYGRALAKPNPNTRNGSPR